MNENWSVLGKWRLSLQFNTQWITTTNVILHNSGRLPLALVPVFFPKPIASCLLPCRQFFLPSRISLAHFFKSTSTHRCLFHSALQKFSNRSWFSNNSKPSATAVLPWCGPSWCWSKSLCPWILDRCLFHTPSHPYFLPLAEYTVVELPHPFGKLLHREFSLNQA